MSSDRRVQNRGAIELRVEYKRLNTFFADYTRNISKGGTFIRTDRPLDVETEFVFALAVPSLEEPLRLLGKVRWRRTAEESSEDAEAGMGIEFVWRDDEERRATERTVEKLMAAELGGTLTAKLLGKP
jgi:type IV pilus assembly protein PilZ